MISKKVKIIFSVAIIALIATLFFLKKEKKIVEIIENTNSSGIKSSLINIKNNEVVYIKCRFENAGILQNTLDQHGISVIASHLLFNRIDGLTPEETIEKLQKLGIFRLSIDATSDDFNFSFFVIKEKMKDALTFLSLAFKNPNISTEDLESIKEKFPCIPNLEFSQPEELMYDKIMKMLFVNHPYGLNETGTAQVISGITTTDILSFIKSKLRSDNLHIIFCGDISKFEMNSYIDLLFDKLLKNNEKNSEEKISADLSKEEIDIIHKPEMSDVVCVMSGIRIEKLSKVELAATFVIIENIFDVKIGDFSKELRKLNIGYKVHGSFIKRSLANIFTITAYMKKEDLEKYKNFIYEKFRQYATKFNLKKLEKTKEYFIAASNNGFTDLEDIDDKIKNASLPYEDITSEILEKVMKMIFNVNAMRTVVCFNNNE